MRLLIVSGIFHPDVGGPATYLHELAHALVNEGHTIAVLTYGNATPSTRYPFPVWRVRRSGSAVGRLCRFTWTLLRVSKDYPLWYVNDYGIPALIVAMIRRPRMVMKIVGDFAWEYARRNHLIADGIDDFQQRRYGGQIRILKAIQRLYVRRAARVIVPSRYLAGLVRGWGIDETRIRVISNAPSWSTVQQPDIAAPVRDCATLFAAARLAPWKGMDHLLEVVAHVQQQRTDLRLVVAGDGPEAPRLRALTAHLQLEGAVEWLGNVAREEIQYWMRHATLFVLLSEYEGLSHVILEAMAEGLPVIASPAGGNAELIADGLTGLLVTPSEHRVAAARILELLEDAPRRQQLAEAAGERLRELSWEALLAQTRAVFAEAQSERA